MFSIAIFRINDIFQDPIANNVTNIRIEATDLNDTQSDIINAITTNGNDRNPLSEWIIGIIGGRPQTEKPPQLDPPEDCEPCS